MLKKLKRWRLFTFLSFQRQPPWTRGSSPTHFGSNTPLRIITSMEAPKVPPPPPRSPPPPTPTFSTTQISCNRPPPPACTPTLKIGATSCRPTRPKRATSTGQLNTTPITRGFTRPVRHPFGPRGWWARRSKASGQLLITRPPRLCRAPRACTTPLAICRITAQLPPLLLIPTWPVSFKTCFFLCL